MRIQLFLLTAMCFSAVLYAQQEETIFGNNGLQLTGAWGSINPGFSSFDDNNVTMGGGFVALEFNKSLLLGIGGSHSNERFSEGLKYDLNAAYLGYIPNGYRAVHPKFSLMIGGGEVKPRNGEEDKIFIVMPGAGVELNIFRWFKFALQGNYRFASNVSYPGLEDSDISGFLFDFQLRFGWSWNN